MPLFTYQNFRWTGRFYLACTSLDMYILVETRAGIQLKCDRQLKFLPEKCRVLTRVHYGNVVKVPTFNTKAQTTSSSLTEKSYKIKTNKTVKAENIRSIIRTLRLKCLWQKLSWNLLRDKHQGFLQGFNSSPLYFRPYKDTVDQLCV